MSSEIISNKDLGSEPESISDEEKADILKYMHETLRRVGLKSEDLSGKKVLDLGSSIRELEVGAKLEKIDTQIVSLDIKKDRLAEYKEPERRAVVGDASNLPFKEESFDLVISSSGPLIEGPYSDEGLKCYQEALRVVKAEGEVRESRAFFGEGGISYYCYHIQKMGESAEVRSQLDSLVLEDERIEEEELERDENSCIIPVGMGNFAWQIFVAHLPIEKQQEIYGAIRDDLVDKLSGRADVNLINVNPDFPIYWPALILRKK